MSTRARRPKAAQGLGGKGALPWTCVFEYVDKDGIKRKGKGRIFNLPEKGDTELYPTGVLCGMLHRSRKCLYAWEENFNFPPALYCLEEDQRRKRWYSRAQLIAIQHCYESFGRLKGKHREKLPQFIEAVRQVFVVVDQPAHKRDS